MCKRKPIFLVVLAVAILMVIGSGIAQADYWIFGYSGGAANYLDVTTGAGPSTLSTAGTLNPGGYNQGWWSGTYANSAGNTNYFVGVINVTNKLNDFFTFNISGLAGQTVTSADLRVYTYGINSPGNLNYYLYDVSTNAATLNYTAGTNAAIYTDLGSGVKYGTFTISPSEAYSTITLNLDAAAIANLNSAIGASSTYFSIGGTVTPVPEPCTLILLGSGLVGLAAFRKRHKRV
jgi:hypothetical protein